MARLKSERIGERSELTRSGGGIRLQFNNIAKPAQSGAMRPTGQGDGLSIIFCGGDPKWLAVGG